MERFDKDEIEIDLGGLLRELIRRWWMFAIAAIIGGLLALIGTIVMITPQYESKAMLYILSKTTSVTSFADFQLSTELTADFEVIATSKPVIDGAVERIQEEDGMTLTREQIQNMIQVTNETDTRILVITARDTDPSRACVVANAVAAETADQMAYIMQSDPPTTVEEAEVADSPVSPSIKKNTAMGILTGILLVALYLTVLYIRNDNIKNQEEVEKYLGLNTLAVIPVRKVKKRENEKKK
ncbi:MAG: YveK family protein [Ruminococcus sp.]